MTEKIIPANPGFSILVFNQKPGEGYDEYPVIGWRVRVNHVRNRKTILEPIILRDFDPGIHRALKMPNGFVFDSNYDEPRSLEEWIGDEDPRGQWDWDDD